MNDLQSVSAHGSSPLVLPASPASVMSLPTDPRTLFGGPVDPATLFGGPVDPATLFGSGYNLDAGPAGNIKAGRFGSYQGAGGGASLACLQGNSLSFNWYPPWIQFWVDGTNPVSLTGASKNFVIPHPTDPDRWLVHACIEGPEAAVFHRGESLLDENGRAAVNLPAYFSTLTKPGTESVLLTPVLEAEGDAFGPVAATRVRDNSFTIRAHEARQRVAWLVEATRADVITFDAEPLRARVKVSGVGPYKWIETIP